MGQGGVGVWGCADFLVLKLDALVVTVPRTAEAGEAAQVGGMAASLVELLHLVFPRVDDEYVAI